MLRLRRIRAELVLHGRDDLAEDLLKLAGSGFGGWDGVTERRFGWAQRERDEARA